jgi:hypothetical protein
MAQQRKPKKEGKIIVPAGVLPEKHELETANYFASLGKDVEFQLPNRTKGSKTPDVMIVGVLWEMKCPFGCGRETIQKCIKRASKQSKKYYYRPKAHSIKNRFLPKDYQTGVRA